MADQKRMIWAGASPNGQYAGRKGPVTPDQNKDMTAIDRPRYGSGEGLINTTRNPNKNRFTPFQE